MQIWVNVKNFAKIEEARKVCINRYTLFVGPNNCGKTFLMQLVEGLNNHWDKLIDDSVIRAILYKDNEKYKVYKIAEETLPDFVKEINHVLVKEKDHIVQDTFGKNIPIESLEIEIDLEKGEEYTIYNGSGKASIEKIKSDGVEFDGLEYIGGHLEELPFSILTSKRSGDNTESMRVAAQGMGGMDDLSTAKRLVITLLKEESLFMPASRNGLLLLYRDFFANKTDKLVSFQTNGGGIRNTEQQTLNLTTPVYRFLRFLQTYSLDEGETNHFKEELIFYNDNIIEGQIVADVQSGLLYKEKEEQENTPMYLTSSMVNEAAPLYLALTARNRYRRFIIDEVEASLHPEKQRELVRFLNRLYNKGCKFVISTHSDTFVNKLNNLAVLSNYIQKTKDENALNNFELEKNDLINIDQLFVYEFEHMENGKCIVQQKTFDERLGYQFDLFTKSALGVYNEALKLEELLENA